MTNEQTAIADYVTRVLQATGLHQDEIGAHVDHCLEITRGFQSFRPDTLAYATRPTPAQAIAMRLKQDPTITLTAALRDLRSQGYAMRTHEEADAICLLHAQKQTGE